MHQYNVNSGIMQFADPKSTCVIFDRKQFKLHQISYACLKGNSKLSFFSQTYLLKIESISISDFQLSTVSGKFNMLVAGSL